MIHRQTVTLRSRAREELLDVTETLRSIAKEHPEACLMSLFVRGTTSAVLIQERSDPGVRDDILECLRRIAPRGGWLHDKVHDNADAHIKAGIVGPSEVIPLEDGQLLLSTWQNVYVCCFDGPKPRRELVVTLV